MIQSELILPIRFYSDIFQQERFNKFHDRTKEVLMNFSSSDLPPFQIKRSHSIKTPDDFVLKKVCNEDSNNYKVVPELASHFVKKESEDFFGSFPKGASGFTISPPAGVINAPVVALNQECQVLEPANSTNYTFTGVAPFAEISIGMLPNFRYSFKMIIERFLNQSGFFEIRIFDGISTGTLIGTFTSANIHTIDFTSVNNVLTIEFYRYDIGDDFEISEIQLTATPLISLSIGDFTLDETQIRVFDKADGTDLLIFPNVTDSSRIIGPGDYYYIVRCDDEYYYSEVFSVKKKFNLQKYYRLKWYDEGDLDGKIMFNTTTLFPDVFQNFIYLDAALFRPEYETTVESEKDGTNTDVPTFKKWSSFISLEIPKSTKYLTDALTSIFLHSKIYIQEPLQNEQLVQNEFEVLEVVSDVEQVANDEFQKVILRFLIDGNFVKTSCEDAVLLDES